LVVADGFCPACGRRAPLADSLAAVRAWGGQLLIDDTQALGVRGEAPGPGAPYGRGGGGSLCWGGIGSPDVLVVSSLAKGFGAPLAALSGIDGAIQRFEERSETRLFSSPPDHMIIDCHCHAGKGDGLIQPWGTRTSLTRYLERAAQAGITRTVLFAAFHPDYAVANREVARITAAHPNRFFGFAFVHPERDRGRILALVRIAVEHYGFCGIKVHRRDARITREICEVARSFELPVLYDVMGEVQVVDWLATTYTDVQFIIPHLGSFSDDWRAQRALIDRLVRYRNVCADTSGVRHFDVLEQAVRRAGAGKILFGSDGPWLHPGLELAKVRALRLSPTEEQLVLGGNLLKLVGRVHTQQGHLRLHLSGSRLTANTHPSIRALG
jgi:uncharacterized protein